MFLALSSMNLIGGVVKDEQVQQVATLIVNDENRRRVLVSRMAENEAFRGERGEQGQQGKKGDPGDVGPSWEPKAEIFDLVSSKSNPESKERDLGEQLFCALATAGESHQQQACVCSIEHKQPKWLLKLTTAKSVEGACSCSAICVE
ncbi:collagen-like triple helix repeat-containing protein [Tropicimonas sp. S265A]|uniref:collagen-like triple helix repeat-containing protein n=1 Tax=Tropicimonas sp. S265A TaxID=3415134 RepID=UPI003C7A832A